MTSEKNCKRILIVEDDADASQLIDRALRTKGYQPYVAENGERALDILRGGVEPCLVLLDLMMPVMNGQEFREAQLNDPSLASIPVVVVSAREDVHEETARMKIPDVIRKPIDMKRLMRFVERYCA